MLSNLHHPQTKQERTKLPLIQAILKQADLLVALKLIAIPELEGLLGELYQNVRFDIVWNTRATPPFRPYRTMACCI